MTRKEAREQAFILLFQNSFRNEGLEELMETEKETDSYQEDEYCTAVVKSAIDNTEHLTELITKYSKGWSLDRISRVSVAALRLAITEMLYFDEIPTAVSINEAVELVKKYATQEDASFVNGILGSVSREQK